MKTFKKKKILSLIKILLYLIKKFIIITNVMFSMYIWLGNHLLLAPLIFLKIIKKKYNSSAEFLCTHFCHQMFSLYIIDIPFSSLLLFPFFWVFLFFCLFPLNLWPDSFYRFFIVAFQVFLQIEVRTEMKWFPVWKLFKLFLNPTICWMLAVLYVRANGVNAGQNF